jgi:O-antigen/teichoic acid export membrane protein
LIAPLSPRLQLGLLLFASGLFVIGVASMVLLLRFDRVERQQDVARRLLRNSAIPLLIQVLVRGIDFGFVMVFYRLLTKDAAGEYELAALLVTLYLGTISEWGLGVLLTRELARDRAAIVGTFGTALLLRLALSVLAIPVALAIIGAYQGLAAVDLIAYGISSRGALVILILALTLLPGTIGSAVTSAFLAAERPVVPAIANLLNNVVSTALRLLALILGLGVVGVAGAAFVATILNAAVFVWLLRRHIGWPGWHWDWSIGRSMLQAAFPLMLNSLLMVVFFRFDTFIIQMFRGTEAVANYHVAYKVPPIALILPPIVVNALFPRFSRQALGDRTGLLSGYRLTLRVLLLIALPLAATVSLFSTNVVHFIAGSEQYGRETSQALAILIWFVPLSYVNGIAQYVLIALDRQSAITRAFVITALFNLGTNMVLVPRWGIAAAAFTTVASELVLYLPFRRVLMAELHAAPLLELLWRPALAIAGSSLGMFFLRDVPLISLVVGALLYGLLLWLTGTVTAEDRQLMRRVLGRSREQQ